ncbi:MAG: hypothetical protein P4L46_15680 [Fimbriimonas sp.]|nr:hypothetical protein [Fimbriimonas sp.]
MTQRIARCWIIMVALVCGLGSVQAADPFQIQIQPAIQGEIPVGASVPLIVDVQNSGPDARGSLRLSTNESEVSYPIELPRGANKRLFAYPHIDYGEVAVWLDTDQGSVRHTYALPGSRDSGMYVLLIGDGPGELSFIRETKGESRRNTSESQNGFSTLLDCYVKPEDVPDRPVGFDGVSCVILGSGAERLTDSEVEALRIWVSTGKTLIFVGGASAPVLSDARWAGMLPIRNPRVASLGRSDVLTNLGGTTAPPVSITSGTPVEGATARTDNGLLLTSEMPFGLGRVAYMSFNPFEAPMNHWEGRRSAVVKLLRVTESLSAQAFVASFVRDSQDYGPIRSYTRPSGTVIAAPSGPMPSVTSMADDPFRTPLPPAWSVFGLLGAYFFFVIPVNFLVLKKLKRGELAWFSAPIISLLFAGVLFASAGSLYRAKMTTKTNGLVVAQEGNRDGLFVGTSQMFIPRGGSYDLKLTGVDALSLLSDQEPFGMYRRPTDQGFESVDVGEYKVPNLAADNLSFRRISYRQKVPISNWFHVRLQKTGPETARCTILAVGPYSLSNAMLYVGNQAIPIGTVQPGDHIARDISVPVHVAYGEISPDDVRVFTVRSRRAALSGDLDGFRPGPQLGDEIKGGSSVKAVLFSDWEADR